MRLFPPSTVPHPWRDCLPVILADLLVMALLYFAFLGVGWLAIHLGAWDWSFVPVTA